MAAPPRKPLPLSATIWAVTVDGEVCTYSDMHEIIHRDIALGNDFRKERIKLLVTVATGVFALMISFNKDLFSGHTSPPALVALLVGFGLLLLSILFGIFHFKAWEDFYLIHRDIGSAIWRYRTASGSQTGLDAATDDFNWASTERKRTQYSYRYYDRLQYTLLLCGLTFVVLYVGIQALQPAPANLDPAARNAGSMPDATAKK